MPMPRNAVQLTRLAVAAGSALLLAGCVGVPETVLPGQITYTCAGNKTLYVERAPDAMRAAVLLEGKTIVLTRAGSAAQEKHTDGEYSLYLDGEKAMLEAQSRVLLGPCISTTPLPQAILPMN